MSNFRNKTVLITGATGGFGRHFTRQLLEKEARLILTDLNLTELETVAQQIKREVGRGEVIACIASDLSAAAGADALFEQVGVSVDVLVNNAGIGLMSRHDETPQGAWERLMQVNLMGPMRLCALFAPQMIERRSGHIVNISSVAGWTHEVGLAAYSASKFGLRGFSVALADELAPHGVYVSAVYPFYSDTAILDSPRYGTLAERNPIEEIDKSAATNPADVVRAVIAGVEANRLHIFPDRYARGIYRLMRHAPWLFERLRRRFSQINH